MCKTVSNKALYQSLAWTTLTELPRDKLVEKTQMLLNKEVTVFNSSKVNKNNKNKPQQFLYTNPFMGTPQSHRTEVFPCKKKDPLLLQARSASFCCLHFCKLPFTKTKLCKVLILTFYLEFCIYPIKVIPVEITILVRLFLKKKERERERK